MSVLSTGQRYWPFCCVCTVYRAAILAILVRLYCLQGSDTGHFAASVLSTGQRYWPFCCVCTVYRAAILAILLRLYCLQGLAILLCLYCLQVSDTGHFTVSVAVLSTGRRYWPFCCVSSCTVYRTAILAILLCLYCLQGSDTGHFAVS